MQSRGAARHNAKVNPGRASACAGAHVPDTLQRSDGRCAVLEPDRVSIDEVDGLAARKAGHVFGGDLHQPRRAARAAQRCAA